MENKKGKFKILTGIEPLTKTDKDLIEIMRAIIEYGNQIIEKLHKIEILIQDTNKRNIGEIIVGTKNKPIEKKKNGLINHLKTMNIPKGYKGNEL